jgi:phosphate uptake regulator
LITYILETPRVTEQANRLIWAAQGLERAADRVTNLYERVVCMTGELVELSAEDTGIEDISQGLARSVNGPVFSP